MNDMYKEENFTIVYAKEDEACVTDIVKALQKAQNIIFNFLNIPFQAIDIDVYIYSNIDDFQDTVYGRLKEQWNVCAIKNNTIHVVSPLSPGRVHKYNDILLILGKAVQDVILNTFFDDIPNWLGITILTSGLMSDQSTYSIPQITNFKNEGYHNYSESYFIANFIFNKFGRDVILEILRQPEKYNKILHLSDSEIDECLGEYYKTGR